MIIKIMSIIIIRVMMTKLMTICKIFTEKPKTSDPLKHASTEAHTALKERGNL